MILQFDVYHGYEPMEVGEPKQGVFNTIYPVFFQSLKYKKFFTSQKFEWVRDITARSESKITIYEKGNKTCEKGDLINGYFISDYFENYQVNGIIVKVEESSDKNEYDIIVQLGMDAVPNILGTYNQTTMNTLSLFRQQNQENFQNTLFETTIDMNVLSPQTSISNYSIFNQIMKRVQTKEIQTIESRDKSWKLKKWEIDEGAYVEDFIKQDLLVTRLEMADDQNIYSIFLNDEIFKNLKIEFSEIETNKLLVNYTQDELLGTRPYLISYYDSDKNIINTRFFGFHGWSEFQLFKDKNLKVPFVSENLDIETIQDTEGNPILDFETVNKTILETVDDFWKGKEFNNKIEFEIPISFLDGERFIALKFDNSFLGRQLNVILKNGQELKTIISKFEISDDESVKVTLGLSRTDLSSILKIKGGK